MKLLVPMLRKDFSNARSWVIASWVIQLLEAIFFCWMEDNRSLSLAGTFLVLIHFILLFQVMMQIIRMDTFAGTTGFLLSRPISRSRLLASKILFFFLFLLLPHLLLIFIKAAVLGMKWSIADAALMIMETTLEDSLCMALGMLASSFTRLRSVQMMIVVAAVVGFGLTFSFLNRSRFLDNSLGDSRCLLWLALLVLSVLGTIILWAHGRRLLLSTVTLMILISGDYLLACNSQWNFVKSLSRKWNPADALIATPEIKWEGDASRGSDARRNGENYFSIMKKGHIQGLKKDWEARLISRNSVADFPDGNQVRSLNKVVYFPGPSELSNIYINQFGIPLPERLARGFRPWHSEWEVFECPETDIRQRRREGMKIHGQGTFELYQAAPAAELPLKKGAELAVGRSLYKITQLLAYDSQIQVTISTKRLLLRSRGEAWLADIPECLLVNPETQDMTSSGSGNSNTSALTGMTFSRRTFQLSDIHGKSFSPEQMDRFLKGARLYILEKREAGTITLPYEVNDMSLVR